MTVCVCVCVRVRLGELSEALDKKGQDMEALHRDMEQVERDGLMEVRRLRVQLNSAEQEVNEVGQGQTYQLGDRISPSVSLSLSPSPCLWCV